MTTREAAKIIGCSIQHVRTLIRQGKLKAKRIESDQNQYGFRFVIDKREAVRFAKLPVPARGFPRGQSRK